MAKDSDIKRRMDRVEEIIDQLDADEVSPEDGRELYDEGQELLAEIREQLQEGDGEVIEIE
ncbi:exodeoxyribonuclease VII small subunit [Haloarcula sp. Atlit-47R]|uniref:exodeoxyribonuclease VII small subunit n=1 Tax=Haloarcula sp. Atlit-47R TaxID=2282132 RepID=UPI000EF24BDE|nr:exodeoxyribonuclease VII small subunit [Haloarcula sp. Atlit-47R]RLM41936.1 exodeoxyribonuclease VII small subunit [Haloarcula sp. Atlit-47R]